MQNIPKSVVNRLESQVPKSHPDADLLTAFAEQSLAESERDQVMEHLARCGDCREVVALAMPAFEEVVVVKPAKAGPWFSWPVFRWSFVTAGILAVASIGLMQLRHGQERTMVATSLQSTEPLREAQTPQPAPSAAPQAAAAESSSRALVQQKVVQQKKEASSSAAPADKSVTTANAVFQQPRPMQRLATGIVGGVVHGAASSGPGAGRSFAAAPIRSQNNFSSAQATSDDSITVGKAKPASPQASPVMPSPLLHTDPTLMQSLPRWTISDNGALQRSLDSGKTWQDVSFAAEQSAVAKAVRSSQPEGKGAIQSAVEVSGAASVVQNEPDAQSGADASQSQSQVKYKESKDARVSSARPVFHALSVSSNNAEVWAGGSGAALYHTVDAGNHWVQVVPADSGAILTGDVLSIQFDDIAHGTVRTSSGESWITVDDGQTWHKQQ